MVRMMNIKDERLIVTPPKVLEGEVIKVNLKQKMIKVLVTTKVRHPIYGKYEKRSKKYNVHWEGDQSLVEGDTVEFIETRPISKIKHHMFLRKVK